MQISLIMSSIRPHNWQPLLDSLKSNTIKYEVIGSGFLDENIRKQALTEEYPEFKYIKTEDIKPAQCYEISRRAAKGELVGWISDDCIFPEGGLDKIYKFYKNTYEESWVRVNGEFYKKIVIAVKNYDKATENNELNDQRFFARNYNTPQMARYGFMSREYLEHLKGFDSKYVYGKFADDVCMRVLADGGKVVKFTDVTVNIDNSVKNGATTNWWTGVNQDSESLEHSWVIEGYKDYEKAMFVNINGLFQPYFPISNREVTLQRLDRFEPFEEKGLLTDSQGKNTRWR